MGRSRDVDGGGRVVVLFEENAEAEIMFDVNGETGTPGSKNKVSKEILTQKPYSSEGGRIKYYFKDKVREGKCGYYNPKTRKTLYLKYDGDKIPYLGIWINDGGFKGMYNAAIEPATIPYDSPQNARARNMSFAIKPKESFEFTIVFDIV